MATNCLVAGRVVCGGRPLEGVAVRIRLLNNNKRATSFQQNTATDATGGWAAAFDVDVDIAEIGFAEITVTCPDGPVRRYLAGAEASAAGTASRTLRVMIENVGTDLISRVIGFTILTPILSTDFAFIVANGRTVDCCPQAAGSGGGTGVTGGVGTGPGGAPGGGSGPGSGTGGAGGTGTAGGAGSGLSPEELLRRMEEAARRAEEAARRAEEERRRAEEERRRAEEERRRAEDAARRAEQARRDAEAALAEAMRLNRVRTRVCFDLAGKARSAGRAGVTIAGESVVVDVMPGQTASDILGAIADALRSRGFDVEGPRVEPGTGEVVICVLADAAGRDPTGGGIGSIDVLGLSRFSARRQTYRPALALAAPPAEVKVALGGAVPETLAALELVYTTSVRPEPQTLRIDAGDDRSPSGWADQVLASLPGAVVFLGMGAGGEPVLGVASLADDDLRIESIATLESDDSGAAAISVGRASPPTLPRGPQEQQQPLGKSRRPG